MRSVSEPAPVVVVDDLRVSYKTTRERAPTLRRTLAHMRAGRKTAIYVEALRGVSFQVMPGAIYGVIGRNGAGKSTLFRTIAGILPPTAGRITLRGTVTPLMALGVGFNKELTGHENILIGGLAMGLDPDEVDEVYDDVVAFAALGDALHWPIRTYSSGMGGRLGFAVAAHMRPDILLIDEALAAGDAAFKEKCMRKIHELCQRDCTVMLISHALSTVSRLADRCLWLENGLVRAEGAADEMVESYLSNEGMESHGLIEDI